MAERRQVRCAVYTRKSSEERLEQSFNSLDAQREACSAYVASQRHEGWRPIRTRYDDGGYSGGTLDRPALQQLLADIQERRVDLVVVYKVDRLTRSLTDFAKIIETLDAHKVSFVSVKHDLPLIRTLARGRRWYEELTSGRTRSMREIAQREHISERYVSRTVHGALIAPDLIERVLQGRQPTQLTISRLRNPLPIDWNEQRRELGIATG